jgi:CxxC motif-containing protein (DUF1111 family)
LIEAIPDATIEVNVHNPAVDGVTGRAAVLSDPVTTAIAASGVGPSNFVGRFGWKCQEATLLAFAGDAYLNKGSPIGFLQPTWPQMVTKLR